MTKYTEEELETFVINFTANTLGVMLVKSPGMINDFTKAQKEKNDAVVKEILAMFSMFATNYVRHSLNGFKQEHKPHEIEDIVKSVSEQLQKYREKKKVN